MGTKHLAANETHQKEILDLLELKCNVLLDLDRQRSSFDHPEFNNATSYCERLWDKILCWPPTVRYLYQCFYLSQKSIAGSYIEPDRYHSNLEMIGLLSTVAQPNCLDLMSGIY